MQDFELNENDVLSERIKRAELKKIILDDDANCDKCQAVTKVIAGQWTQCRATGIGGK